MKLTYPRAFPLLYNCLSSGAETIAVDNVTLDAALDRPVAADGQRTAVHAPSAAAFFIKVKENRLIQLRAAHIVQQLLLARPGTAIEPTSFALRNAFMKTIGVDEFYLIGIWSAPKEVEKGFLVLAWPISLFAPTLPDPYVTNNNPVRVGARELAAGGRLPVTLAGVVAWPIPPDPELRLLLIPDAASPEAPQGPAGAATGSPLLAALGPAPIPESDPPPSTGVSARVVSQIAVRGDQILQTQQEDAAELAALRSLFHEWTQSRTEQIFLLDVSSNADLFGVGIGVSERDAQKRGGSRLPFFIDGMDLVTYAFNTRIYTLPQIQWEPVRTLQNPDVRPYPFPSPATSATTGDPTLVATESYRLVPITPTQVVDTFVQDYAEPDDPKRMAALFSLPFGMQAFATLENPDDSSRPGAVVEYNRPDFDSPRVTGGLQISVIATSPDSGPAFESPHLPGATVQTRDLIELLTGSIPVDDDGKPLSVLGPVVDTIFNREFKPSGGGPRVPLERMDFSGYGATIFSNWLDPNAQIAATSQTKFDVLIGRTSHEIVQVKSILYPWAVAVVRTITIQRTAGGGVTRHDSGWHAQGPGVYDFSYRDAIGVLRPNPYEIHPGVVGGAFAVTGIRDTGRTYRRPAPDPADDVIMQEVFFDADVLLESVISGAEHGFVPSKGQRGFVQLSPSQKPLTPQQFLDLLTSEGALGGPVDCVLDVGQSGQLMRLVQVNVNGVGDPGGTIFVSVGHGVAGPAERRSVVRRPAQGRG